MASRAGQDGDSHPSAPGAELLLRRAPNPGPMTLEGTNSYVLRDGDQVWVVDPGPRDAAHLASLIALCAAEDMRPMGVLVTHRHGDHTEGAGALRRQLEARTGHRVPLWAADLDAVPGAEPLPVDLYGDAGVAGHVIHLPGHTADSVGVLVQGGRLLCGDTLLGGSSTVIVPPDGNLTEYLQSLAVIRAMALDGRISSIHPGHGPAYETPLAALEAVETAIAHREQRIDQIRQARRDGILTVDKLVRTVYGDGLEGKLLEAAGWNVRAALDHLARTA